MDVKQQSHVFSLLSHKNALDGKKMTAFCSVPRCDHFWGHRNVLENTNTSRQHQWLMGGHPWKYAPILFFLFKMQEYKLFPISKLLFSFFFFFLLFSFFSPQEFLILHSGNGQKVPERQQRTIVQLSLPPQHFQNHGEKPASSLCTSYKGACATVRMITQERLQVEMLDMWLASFICA